MNRLSATFSYCLSVVVWNKKKNHPLFDAFLLILKQYTYYKILTIWKFTSTNHFHTFFGKSSTQQQVVIEVTTLLFYGSSYFLWVLDLTWIWINEVSFMKNQSCLDSLLNQRKGSCFLKVWIQSLYSIKERVHAIQRYRYSLFAQLKKGFILFNGINSVSLLNQRKGPCYSKNSM